jgi:hypothetical protein
MVTSASENVTHERKKSLEIIVKPSTFEKTLMNKCRGIGFVQLATLFV